MRTAPLQFTAPIWQWFSWEPE